MFDTKWFWGPTLYPKADNLGTHATALAFNFILALVPFLVVTFAICALVATTVFPENPDYKKKQLAQTYVTIVQEAMPNLKAADVRDIANKVAHRGWATLGFVVAIYTTFAFMMQFVRTLNFIFDDPRKPMTILLHGIKSLVLMAIWMVMLCSICLSFVAEPMVEGMFAQSFVSPLIISILTPLSYLFAFFAIFAAFYCTFALVPLRIYQTQKVVIGSLVASVGWILCGLIFSKILPNFWKYDALYGALGSVVIVMMWGQACAWSVIVGACTIVRFSPNKTRKKR